MRVSLTHCLYSRLSGSRPRNWAWLAAALR